MPAPPRLDLKRLRGLLEGINGFGRDPATGGFDRVAFSPADMAVRGWLAQRMAAEGLAVRRDAAGNVFGRFGAGGGAVVLAGSHLDTVPQGGAYDGALGVAVALECALALRDAGIALARPLEVVATADEEGRFGGMLGSQAIAGSVPPGWVEAATDAGGVPLAMAMRAAGLDPSAVPQAARPAAEVAAFVELHIEQGPILEAAQVPVGLVTAISGCCVWGVGLGGVANHSGTTPMSLRADAFAGLAEIAAGVPGLIGALGTDQSRLTIGHVAVSPNEVHTIPGRADFSVVLRDTDEAVMRRLAEALRARIAEVAARHRLAAEVTERSWLPPVALDRGHRQAARAAADRAGVAALDMPSGAGHDAQTMQGLCPSALIFVASKGGISHAPAEHTAWADIEAGAQVMLELLTDLLTR